MKKAILNLHGDNPFPPRFCNVIVEEGIDGKVYLEMKNEKKITKIPWEDVVYQVEAARAVAKAQCQS